MAKQQSRGWRDKPAPKAPRWTRPTVATGPAAPQLGKRWQLFFALVSFLAMCSLFVWVVLLLRPPRPTRLILLGAAYEENLAVPPNYYGLNSLRALADVVRDTGTPGFWSSGKPVLPHEPMDLAVDTDWANELARFPERNVLLYLAVHGGADSQGAYLLPRDADITADPRNRLRLTAIIEKLASLPPTKRKILMLDVTNVMAHEPLGLIHNNFARGLDSLNERIEEIPNLIVISASDMDQRSWVAEEWGRTAFGHFVAEGFKGAVPATNGRVNALGFFRYVRDQVRGWVRANRDALQTPVLYPRGERGERRALAMELLPDTEYVPSDPASTPEFVAPAELKEVWDTYHALRAERPAPYVYAPQRWREYQEWLLRYEGALRAADTESANKLRLRLRGLEQEFATLRRPEMASLASTLAMPEIAGYALEDAETDKLRSPLNALWDAPAAERVPIWRKLLDGHDGNRALLRARLSLLVLQRAAADPGNSLPKARALIQRMDDPLRPRAAEAHYISMLERDRPPVQAPRYWELLRQSLELRLLAERAALAVAGNSHSYSEQVYRWIKTKIESADQQRRLGQDLLFASVGEHWEQAAGYLQAAEEGYKDARVAANMLRRASGLRDRAFAELPFYNQWAADARWSDDKVQQENEQERLKKLLMSWRATHELARRLETPFALGQESSTSALATGSLAPLAALTNSLERELLSFEKEYEDYCRGLANADLQKVWYEAERALFTPFLDTNLRLTLLSNVRRTARRFHLESATPGTDATPLDPAVNLDQARAAASRRGQLALAALGERWFEDSRFVDSTAEKRNETYAQVDHRFVNFIVEEHWWESLTQGGDQVGLRHRELSGAISNTLRAAASPTNREQCPALLRDADHWSRLASGATSRLLDVQPAVTHRDWCLAGLLLWQTQRTLVDHWFGDDPQRPYFRVAGSTFVDDASQLDRHTRYHVGEIQTQRALLAQDGLLTVEAVETQHMTSEPTITLPYRIRPREGSPPGFPVAWIDAGEPALTTLVHGDVADRRGLRLGQLPIVDRIQAQVSSPYLAAQEREPPRAPEIRLANVHFRGVYRGQQLQFTTKLDLHPLAEMIHHHAPLPRRASVAVRANEELHDRFTVGTGTVVFILDCSGSMRAPQGDGQTRFDKVKQAVGQVIRRLPAGTRVSVWAFGQETSSSGVRQRSPYDAEATIERLHEAPFIWEPSNNSALTAVLERVQRLQPYNYTPIVRAMMQARRDLDNTQGLKTMLVLTDGMDTRFVRGMEQDDGQGDPEYNPDGSKTIPAFLTEQFANSGIAIKMVGFQLGGEADEATKQFKEPLEKMGGAFVLVDQAPQLGDELSRLLNQKLRFQAEVEGGSLVPGISVDGIEVGSLGADYTWLPRDLGPGRYFINLRTNRVLDEREFVLTPGDLLLLKLVAQDGAPRFQRALYSREEHPSKPFREEAGWRLAALQNQPVRADAQGLDLLLTMEKIPAPDEATLRFIKPKDIWFELATGTPVAGGTAFSVRQRYNFEYPAPTWSMHIGQWPRQAGTAAPAAPIARVWWDPDEKAIPVAVRRVGDDYQNVRELVGTSFPVNGGKAVFTGAGIEKHFVEVQPGVFQEQPCLAIRLDYPTDQPVWVRLQQQDLQVGGVEHRFYTRANSYTALFWPIRDERVAQELSVIAVKNFQASSRKQGYFLEKSLGTPRPSDTRPVPSKSR